MQIRGGKLTAHDRSLHSNVTSQGSDNVGSLLLLVPSDNGVEEQNTANDTEINPITETGSQ